jgi:hypothetical protein
MNLSMLKRKRAVSRVAWFCLLAALVVPAVARAAAPDLTATDLSTIDTTRNYSLGPTGMRGWIYRNTASGAGAQGLMTAASPWQILVVTVGANTPST